MSQKLKTKHIVQTDLANNYGGWIYCGGCKQTIGYLCYVTYHNVSLSYVCKCGNHGSLSIIKDDETEPIDSSDKLIMIKNRLCCPSDQEPLLTILHNKLDSYSYKITCNKCSRQYEEKL